jgi:putative DNA primase/helicase
MIDGDQLKQDVVGKWPGIFNSLGIDVGDGRHKECVMCGGKDRFRFDDKEGKGTYYCNGCGPGDGWSIVQKVLGVDFPGALKEIASIIGSVDAIPRKEDPKVSADVMRSIFMGSDILKEGDPAYRYLTGRGLTKLPTNLRYHKKCWELETKKNQKAMLAVFTSKDNTALTMHRTYLTAEGEKLKIKDAKKIIPALEKLTGGACRLFPVAENGVLGIAEGIETAIATTELFGIPTWAATTAILMEKFVPPNGVKKLVVFGDNDFNYTGHKAAYGLANAVNVQRHMPVEVKIPLIPGQDWLDVLVSKKS